MLLYFSSSLNYPEIITLTLTARSICTLGGMKGSDPGIAKVKYFIERKDSSNGREKGTLPYPIHCGSKEDQNVLRVQRIMEGVSRYKVFLWKKKKKKEGWKTQPSVADTARKEKRKERAKETKHTNILPTHHMSDHSNLKIVRRLDILLQNSSR